MTTERVISKINFLWTVKWLGLIDAERKIPLFAGLNASFVDRTRIQSFMVIYILCKISWASWKRRWRRPCLYNK